MLFEYKINIVYHRTQTRYLNLMTIILIVVIIGIQNVSAQLYKYMFVCMYIVPIIFVIPHLSDICNTTTRATKSGLSSLHMGCSVCSM